MFRKTVSSLMLLLLAVSTLAVAVKIQPASADVDWWPMFHHDLNHTGTSTSTAPTTNNTLWSYTTGSRVWSSPAVAGGVVYVGSLDGKIYALDAATGAFIWSYSTGNYVTSSPAVAGGVVYVGSYDDNVYALNAATGAFIWSYSTGSWMQSSPAVADGKVYVGSTDYKVYALNATTGAQVWNYTTGDSVYSSPAVADGKVYVGSTDYKVYALNATTGAQVWNYTTGGSVASSPVVAGGVVYVGSDDDNVYALNATTGAQVWNYTTGTIVWSSPAVAGGVVYVGSGSGKVFALDATTGAFIWSYTTGWSVVSSPVVAGGVVYVGSFDDKVYAFGVYDVPVTSVRASFTYWPPTPEAGDTVTFDASGSTPNGTIVTLYTWDFGDGKTTATSNALITHVYASPDTHNITLTVTNSEGLTGSTWQELTVSPATTLVASDTANTGNYFPINAPMGSTSQQIVYGEAFGDSILILSNRIVTQVAFLFEIEGSPTCNVTANIYESFAGIPSGPALARSVPTNVTTIRGGWVNFTFPVGQVLNADTHYCFDVESTGGGIIDHDNFVWVGQDHYCTMANASGFIYTNDGTTLHWQISNPSMLGKTNTEANIQVYGLLCCSASQYNITFGQTGIGSDFTGTVVAIDGTSYTAGELPVSFLWNEGSIHSFSFASPLNVNASRGYCWWSTSGLSSLKNGTLTVMASGNVTATFGLTGDITHDGKVSLADLVLFATAYHSCPGDSNWNPECDVAPPYGIIGLTDAVTLAMHYGQHYP